MFGAIFAAGEQIELFKLSINKIENYLEICEYDIYYKSFHKYF